MLLPVLVVIFLKESSTVFVINQVIAYLAGDIGTACGKVFLMSLLFLLGRMMMFQKHGMIYSKVAK